MIVVDASALVAALLPGPEQEELAPRLISREVALHAPHHLDLEVASALRRASAKGELALEAARAALDDLRQLRMVRHPHAPFLPRIWELRGNLTPYDAAYVALAEILDAPLITRDARLARAAGVRARIELV
ncbi:MAG TPA: type II toxin-antitoxin system VapC family toxin [Caulobacteraceae bacterium]|nr:type II toxin-antitoxin system VapC family toxin [Caulobacteraceae bacterium]